MKNQIKENSKVQSDKLNITNVKINLQKGKKDLFVEGKNVKKNIYIGELDKSERDRIRRFVKKSINNILGKDRSDSERTEAIQNFLKFYKENWKVCDFKIENFTSSNEGNRYYKECKNLLDYLNSVLSK